jgi:hypothetical protein
MTENTISDFLKAVSENESLLKGYASSKCAECLGRGYITLAHPGESFEKYMCSCVRKRALKDFKDG